MVAFADNNSLFSCSVMCVGESLLLHINVQIIRPYTNTKFPSGIFNEGLMRFKFYGVQECNQPLLISDTIMSLQCEIVFFLDIILYEHC